MASNIWTVRSVLNWTTKYLSKISRSPRTDAEILLSYVSNKNRLWLYTNFDSILSKEVLKKFHEIVELRFKGVPVYHITGEKYFMALKFKVNDRVLVPRPETEELVEHVIMDSKKVGWKRFVDIGCGSGVIAVSIAKYLPDSHVWAVDVNRNALELTCENAKIHNVSDRVHVEGNKIEHVDVVVSNPPYLTQREWEELPELHHEPYEALVGGKDGNDVYKYILQKYSPKVFYFEIAHPFRGSLKRIFEENGFNHKILKDLSKRDRIAVVWK